MICLIACRGVLSVRIFTLRVSTLSSVCPFEQSGLARRNRPRLLSLRPFSSTGGGLAGNKSVARLNRLKTERRVGAEHQQNPSETTGPQEGAEEIIIHDTGTSGVKMPKAAWYGVHTGRQPGVYTTWAEAEAQVKGFNGAKFKKFRTEAQAVEFIGGQSIYARLGTNGGESSHSTPSSTKTVSSQASGSKYSRTNSIAAAGVSSGSGSGAKGKARATSPLSEASPADLSPRLQTLAWQGWSFTAQGRVVVYTDGSGLGNGQKGARAGLGVWWGSEDKARECNLSERVPGVLQTNNRGEILSVIRALETCPFDDLPIEIRTDSEYTIMCMTTYLPIWQRKGFKSSTQKEIKNLDLIKHLLVLLQKRSPQAGVKFKHVRGHAGIRGNEEADVLARRGAAMPSLPDRKQWLDPDAKDANMAVAKGSVAPLEDIEVEIDDDCLMSAEELKELEEELA